MSGPLVTISAAWGTGGSWIGPHVAERLDVAFVDRALTREVADDVAALLDTARVEQRPLGTALARALQEFTGRQAHTSTTPMKSQVEVDQGLLDRLVRDGGVVLGRAGAVILHAQERALHVRLVGPDERRIEQGMRIEGIDEVTARWRLASGDLARDAYVRHFWNADPQSQSLYQLTIDSTRLPLPAVATTIAAAALALSAT